MTDTIASRVTRVIGGSVHALLDVVENAAPEATMAQAIREVDQAIDEVRGELGRVEATKHVASSSLNKLNTQKETLAEQIDLAMTKGDETLARAGIARQIDIDDQIPVLQRSLQDSIGRGKELEGYIAALTAKKREMESALQDFIAGRAAAAAPAAKNASSGTTQGKVDRAGAAFDRVMARETGLAVAGSGVNADAAKLQELQEMARTHRIDERLAALKARTAGDPKVSGIFAPELWPFSLAIVVLIGVAAAEALALVIGASFLHWHADFSEHPDGVPDGALGWLHFGKVPLLVILVIFLTAFALAGFLAQFAARAATGSFSAGAACGRARRRRGGARCPCRRLRAEPDHPARRDHGGVRCEPGRPGRQRRDRYRARRQAGAGARARPARHVALRHGRARGAR